MFTEVRAARRMLSSRPLLTAGRISAAAVAIAALSVALALDGRCRPGPALLDTAILIGAASAVGLLSAVNLAILTSADILTRRDELALRAIVGAPAFRLAAPELLQSGAVAAIGTLAGCPAALVVASVMARGCGTELAAGGFGLAAACGCGGTLAVMVAIGGAQVFRVWRRPSAYGGGTGSSRLYSGRGASLASRDAAYARPPAGAQRIVRSGVARRGAGNRHDRLPRLGRVRLG